MRNFGAPGQAGYKSRAPFRASARKAQLQPLPGKLGLLSQPGFPGWGQGQASDSEEDLEVTDEEVSADEGLPFWAKALIATSVTGVVGFVVARRAGWF